jgi:hypothetical protein
MQEASPTSLTERCPPRYEALLAVSEVISLQRDLSALLQDLVRYLRPVADFNFIKLLLYDADKHVMRLHVFDSPRVRLTQVTRFRLKSHLEAGRGGRRSLWLFLTLMRKLVSRH